MTRFYLNAGALDRWPRESAIRDVCRLAARDRGFEYKGYLRNTLTFGYITDPKNICKLGIVD